MDESHWKEIKEKILSKGNHDIHKMVWDDYAVLTDKSGRRYKVNHDWPLYMVDQLIAAIRHDRAYYNFSRYIISVILTFATTFSLN